MLVCSLMVVLLTSLFSINKSSSVTPKAIQGQLDLSSWSFVRDGIVKLDGEWEFYEGELLTPQDFVQRPIRTSTLLKVPGSWLSDLTGKGMSRTGYGTYRLRLQLPAKEQILGLDVANIRMSHLLYVNGQLVGDSGRPAPIEQDDIPANRPYQVFVNSHEHEMDILIQVSNYTYMTGGIVNSITLGSSNGISTFHSIQLGSSIAIILLLGMSGAYHLCLYLLRRQEKAYLYSGLFQLSIVVIQMLIGEKLALKLVPELPFAVTYKLLDLSIFFSGIMISMFYYVINKKFIFLRRIHLFILPVVLTMILIALMPMKHYSLIKLLGMGYLAFAMLSLLVRVLYVYVRVGRHSTERKELMLFIGSVLSQGAYFLFSVLHSESGYTYLATALSIISFITCLNILLALRYTNAYTKTEQLTHELELSNQLKDEFLTNTSHELKTPLHGIMNISSYLLDHDDQLLTEQHKQNLWLIKDTSTKLSMLINDLIDVSQLKHGKIQLKPQVVDLHVVTQIVTDVLHFELLGKPVILENDVRRDVHVYADENRLRQIMYNLLQNAIKFTDKGTIRIISESDEGNVLVSIIDSGIGIRADQLDTIFDYGEQFNIRASSDGYTGMGVGLYVCKKLLEQMDGTITVKWSSEVRGTCIQYTLPRAALEKEENPSQDYVAATSTASYVSRMIKEQTQLVTTVHHAQTILIVDDEPSNIVVLHRMLESHPYNVVTALSAQQALDRLQQSTPIDLVILDIMMPKVSGIELCQILRKQYSILELPILLATIKESPQDIALGFHAGANDFITKPFDAKTMLARIQTLIAMKTSIREAVQHEIAFYQAQIQPHFLFNAMNSILALCHVDADRASHLLLMLSQYMRYLLEIDHRHPSTTVQQELELIRVYVEIEKARFGERFDVEYEIDPQLLVAEVPSLCIQPFVENSIRHGLFHTAEQGKVKLSINEDEGQLMIRIEDNGVGMSSDELTQILIGGREEQGIGITNIRKRIEMVAGATLLIRSSIDKGTIVTIRLPLVKKQSSIGG